MSAADKSADKAWFSSNPVANYRIRPPRDQAEVDELARALLPPGSTWQDGFKPSSEWHVLVIKLPMRRVARVLTMAAPDPDGDFHAMPIALGTRLALN